MLSLLLLLFSLLANVQISFCVNEVTKCEYYNETECKKPNEKCDAEQIDNCKDINNGTKRCFVVWGNNTNNGAVTVKFKGCFTGDKTCDRKDQCIHFGNVKNGRFFCCCEGDMCNKEFFWHPTSEPPSPPPSEPHNSEIVPRNLNVIALMAILPVLIICVLTVIVVFKRQKRSYLKQVATSDIDSDYIIPPEEEILEPVEFKQLKAKGRFGCVWVAEFKNELVAVKIFPVQHKQSWLTEQEIFRLPLMNHENILRFIGVDKRGEELQREFWLITAYHSNGSLCDYLKSNTITWEQLCHIAHTMMKGLSHLHEEIRSKKEGLYKPAIAHRDFKSSNVLLKDDLTACIADFGLAIIFRSRHAEDKGHAQVGTARYMAPEVLAGAVNINKDSFLRIDMYSCGLVLWELISRCSTHKDHSVDYKLPFEEELGQHPSLNDLYDFVVHKKKRPVLKESWKSHIGLSSLCDTVEECWDEDTDSRLSSPCVMERIAWYIRPPSTPFKNRVVNKLTE